MKPFRWSAEKNESLKLSRGVSFESIVIAIEAEGLLDIVEHPNVTKYPNQRVLVVSFDGYVYLAPFVEEADYAFMRNRKEFFHPRRRWARQNRRAALQRLMRGQEFLFPCVDKPGFARGDVLPDFLFT